MARGSSSLRHLVRDKLGVCPFCMRSSAAGSIGFALLYVLARFAVPRHAVTALLLLPLAAFLALFLAHLVAYMTRMGMRLRRMQRAAASKYGRKPLLTRREFVARVLRAGGYALTISLFGSIPAFAGRQDTCSGAHSDLDRFIEGLGATERAARSDYFARQAIVECDFFCKNEECDGGLGCLQSGQPVVTEPHCRLEGQIWSCKGHVKQCTCSCTACDGQHRPPTDGSGGLDDPGAGSGVGGNQGDARDDAKADALTKCDNLCAKFKNCTTPKTCKRDNDPQLGDMKVWEVDQHNYGASVPIKTCRCKCK